MSKQFYSLTILEIRNETADCISIKFEIPRELRQEFKYSAGQNITLRLMMQGQEIRRSYSICSSPHENEFRIAVKKAEQGLFSSHAHQHFRVNDVLEIMPPSGSFHLPTNPENKKHYIAFAAGSGITPVISILKTILKEEPLSHVTLVYGNKNRNSVIFQEELLGLKNRYATKFQLISIFSREKMDSPLFEGRIDAKKCESLFRQIVPMAADQEYVLCGPATMIFSIRDWLLPKKISPEKIHFELFSGLGESSAYSKKTAFVTENPSLKKTTVTVILDGVSTGFTMPAQGPSILEAAIVAGADLPWACRAGVCATCRAKLVQGTVTMDQNYALAEEEIAQGFILTCQSHPTSENLLVDFDIR